MRLGIDLDGVVTNFTADWKRFYNKQIGTTFIFEDSKNWGDLVDLTHFQDINEFWARASDIDGHSIFWHLDPFPGAIDTIRSLVDTGHQIVVITTKPSFAINDTHIWLERHRVSRPPGTRSDDLRGDLT